jgi:hypothetical protein
MALVLGVSLIARRCRRRYAVVLKLSYCGARCVPSNLQRAFRDDVRSGNGTSERRRSCAIDRVRFDRARRGFGRRHIKRTQGRSFDARGSGGALGQDHGAGVRGEATGAAPFRLVAAVRFLVLRLIDRLMVADDVGVRGGRGLSRKGVGAESEMGAGHEKAEQESANRCDRKDRPQLASSCSPM